MRRRSARAWNADEIDFEGDVQGWDLAAGLSTKYTGPDGSPEWFRFGASSLLNDVLMQIQFQRSGRYQDPDAFTLD